MGADRPKLGRPRKYGEKTKVFPVVMPLSLMCQISEEAEMSGKTQSEWIVSILLSRDLTTAKKIISNLTETRNEISKLLKDNLEHRKLLQRMNDKLANPINYVTDYEPDEQVIAVVEKYKNEICDKILNARNLDMREARIKYWTGKIFDEVEQLYLQDGQMISKPKTLQLCIRTEIKKVLFTKM